MPVKRIVNTSPLVFLAREGLLEILQIAATDVVVPDAVVMELGRRGLEDPTYRSISGTDWLRIAPAPIIPPEVEAWKIGAGESSVIALALAEPGAQAVIDDLEARRCARRLSIPLIGTLGLVILARQEGRIPAARPVIERLRASGMYLSDRVIDQALGNVSE